MTAPQPGKASPRDPGDLLAGIRQRQADLEQMVRRHQAADAARRSR